MHSRIFIKSLSISLRTSLVGLSLTGFSMGSEQLLNYPMTGACFLHDSGLEYIPSRLLGVEDIVAETDRGESCTWTCTDPAVDCAAEAERFEQQQRAIEQWNRWYSSAESLRNWSLQSLSQGIARVMREWNSSLVAVGRGLAHRVSIDSPIDNDSPWDDVETAADATQEHCLGYIPSPRFRNANVFVFTVDMTADATADEEALKEQQAIDAGRVASPSDRIIDSLGGTTFARDYCVFAPYPLSDAITPLTESSVLAGEEQTRSGEDSTSATANNSSSDSINTSQTSSPCEWMGECEPVDSSYVQGGDPRVPREPTNSIQTIDSNEVVPSSAHSQPTDLSRPTDLSQPKESSQPAEFSQPTELDQASDRASGAGPEDSAVAGVSDCEATPTIDSREILRAQQQVALDLQQSISRALDRNLSAFGQSLIRCWKELGYRVRLSEAHDAFRLNEVK
jgi:hypothetical protein